MPGPFDRVWGERDATMSDRLAAAYEAAWAITQSETGEVEGRIVDAFLAELGIDPTDLANPARLRVTAFHEDLLSVRYVGGGARDDGVHVGAGWGVAVTDILRVVPVKGDDGE